MLLAAVLGSMTSACAPMHSDARSVPTEQQARRMLEDAYAANRAAFLAKDLTAILAQRAPDFHAVTPDGATHSAAEMAQATQNLLNNVLEWRDISFQLGRIWRAADGLSVDVQQHTARMVRRDGRIRQLENWVTQRETWVRTPQGLKIRRVENIRDQCVLVDGALRDASQQAGCRARGVRFAPAPS